VIQFSKKYLKKRVLKSVTDEPGSSNHFLKDLKNLVATAEGILKKVQDKLEEY